MDQYRRWLGNMLDASGLAPPSETPFHVVFAEPMVTLKEYATPDSSGPVIVLVSAPIKRAYIWDLVPWASVVRRCMTTRARVYLIQWEAPGRDEQGFGLPEYADRLILDCLQAIATDGRQPSAFLVGHSLGGTLAAIFAALHPELVQGLVLLGSPLHFGPDVGALGPWVAVAPVAQLAMSLCANIPGSFLDVTSILAAPVTFEWARWMDWFASLSDARALQTHLRVERWALDEQMLSRQLFQEIIALLYREDRFLQGDLVVGGQRAEPRRIECPILSVVDPCCTVVPPQSILPFHGLVASTDTQLLWYTGDTGVAVQHLGMLVGRMAHQQLWPEILRWVHTHALVKSGG